MMRKFEGAFSGAGFSTMPVISISAPLRAFGAMGAVQLEQPRDFAWMKDRFVERGVWVRPFGKLVYAMPPFVMSSNDIATLTAAMVDVVAQTHTSR